MTNLLKIPTSADEENVYAIVETAATGLRQPAAGRWRSARAPSLPSIRS